ncbi:cell division ATPase MinD [Methanococcus aeolicus]|uniref:Cell division ATPase MinD n=1 Tax=Methanococcus aeolicus (strain ATCC BAA-1280 / DSM 17508 / OCM 812 / Nankai-3) TaxID=419665 RepID=A6UTW5_META3|nr:cell division ATPase MinD [Methanococcus aeolicus]ABR55937.1 cell division ATPase MinD [Methanococcus aeolicus Nankai-3]UXM85464.1 cell division ATPase MinD [Methanococcus aeolicus]
MIITVASGKGGVGKTTTTANLGVALSKIGKNVLIVDGDISMANLALIFGFEKKRPSLHEVLSEECEVGEAIYKHNSGVSVLPASLSIEGYKKSDLDIFPDAISEVADDYDYVLIDAPAGLNRDMAIHLAIADKVLIVLTPELFSIADGLKIKQSSEMAGTSIIGAILNRTGRDYGEMKIDEIEMIVQEKIICAIPEDGNIRNSTLKRRSVIEYDPNTPASKAYMELALKITGSYVSVNKIEEIYNENLTSKIKRFFSKFKR